MTSPIRVLFATSEVYPLAKTGGLADVSAGLPRMLRRLGVDVRLVTPGYESCFARLCDTQVQAELGNVLGVGPVRLVAARSSETEVPVWLIDAPALYRRKGGPYQDEQGREWPDNHLRFAVFAQVVAQLGCGVPAVPWQPQLVHANDWHVGLTPYLLARGCGHRAASVFTIHNAAFQGLAPSSFADQLGLSSPAAAELALHGRLSFLKAGIVGADALTTVSPSYAKEILTPRFGYGLEDTLAARQEVFYGILNGIDDELWNPGCDPCLPARFDATNVAGKAICKSVAQDVLGLSRDSSAPLIAVASRLTSQKMSDLLLNALPALLSLRRDLQIAILGEGESTLERDFLGVAGDVPGRLAVRIGHDETLERRLLAGADILLHGSRFEPCGLLPIYAMRYGTPPVVSRVGGHRDTVLDLCHASSGVATGFLFDDLSIAGMCAGLSRALAVYENRDDWRALQFAGMTRCSGWEAPAREYLALYQAVLNKQPHRSMVEGT